MANPEDGHVLQTLVDSHDFVSAKRLCAAAIESGAERDLWLTQQVYLYFLDEKNLGDRYVELPKMIARLVNDLPLNGDLRFWHGYFLLLISNNQNFGREELLKAVSIDPTNSYPYLVLAGMGSTANDNKQELYEKVLSLLPNHYRALEDFAYLDIDQDRKARARRTLQRILDVEPFWETRYGIMNRYVNAVLTLASHRDDVRGRARTRLRAL